MDNVINRCYEEDLRVMTIIHLDTMIPNPDRDIIELMRGQCFDLFIEAIDESPRRDLIASMDEEEFFEEIGWWAPKGWMIQAGTPVRMQRGKMIMMSWGQTWIKWFYAPSYDDALVQAFEWASSTPIEVNVI